MKASKYIALLLCSFLLMSCNVSKPKQEVIEHPKRVVALTSSLAQLWVLGGGQLVGATSDAFGENPAGLSPDCVQIGTIKAPNLEKILALKPDLVLLSDVLAEHAAIQRQLESFSIATKSFDLDTPEQYLQALAWCTDQTGDKNAYVTNGVAIVDHIDKIKESFLQQPSDKPILLLRGLSTKIKALDHTSLVGTMLSDLGVHTLSDKYPSLLKDLSTETILAEDPGIILVVPMGDIDSAQAILNSAVIENPVFSQVSAVKNHKVYMLPKDLFHYKPNNRWDESYAYLVSLLSN